MGRGRAKAKQTKVARKLKYQTLDTDLDALQRELAGDSGDGMQLAGTQMTNTSAIFGNDVSTLPDFPAEIRAPAGTLAGGEAQRIRLASQIGSGLTGVLYVLDEPSIGLHQRDGQRLIRMLEKLRDLGVLMRDATAEYRYPEHDQEFFRRRLGEPTPYEERLGRRIAERKCLAPLQTEKFQTDIPAKIGFENTVIIRPPIGGLASDGKDAAFIKMLDLMEPGGEKNDPGQQKNDRTPGEAGLEDTVLRVLGIVVNRHRFTDRIFVHHFPGPFRTSAGIPRAKGDS